MKNKILELLNSERENYVERDVEDLYNMVSQRTGVPVETVAAIGGIESTHGKFEENPRSNAKGVFQTMPAMIKALYPEGQESPKSFTTQEEVMTGLLNATLKKLGKDVSPEDMYLKHNLGSGKFRKLSSLAPDEPVEKVLPKQVVRANKELFQGKSLDEVRDFIEKKLNKGLETFEPKPKFEDTLKQQNEFLNYVEDLKQKRGKK